MSTNKKYLPFLAFCCLGLIWGSNFIYMKLAAQHISSLQIAFYRILCGFIPVFIYAIIRKDLHWRQIKHSGHFIVMGLLASAVYYYGFAKGTSLLLSGVAGALSGAIPLFSFLLAIIFLPEERATPTKIIGVLVGLAGVILIARPTGAQLNSSNLEGVLYIVGGSLSVGASFVYAKKFIIPLRLPAVALTTYQLAAGLLALGLITDFSGSSQILTSPHAAIGLVIGLGFLGTGLAYIIYYFIVAKLGAVSASSVTYIPPLVSLLIGTLLVGEIITTLDYCATALIFIGVFLLKR
jgi:drug/metabolite transporter (DMT)-like permease